ncbi:MAG: hypothetical protein AAF533_27610, partial [Acidobacteriota bacterium]
RQRSPPPEREVSGGVALEGEAAGTWTLTVEDFTVDDGGSLFDWGISSSSPLPAGACTPCDVSECPLEELAPTGLRVRKTEMGEIVLSHPEPSGCAVGVAVFVAADPRPEVGEGSFPMDPAYVDRSSEDLDPGAEFRHVPPAGNAFYLVVERSATGEIGPSGHHPR